ncbi:GspE/PulE family protein [Candidatus Margulisiibacteriota bacterium]
MKNSHLTIQVPSLDIDNYIPDEKAIALIMEAMAQRLHVLPLFKVDNTLVVGMTDPSDFIALNELQNETDLDIFPVKVDMSSLEKNITYYYENVDTLQDELNDIVQEIKQSSPVQEKKKPTPVQLNIEEETPMIKLVNAIIKQSVKMKASDIHIEPEEDSFRLRFRIDGILQEMAIFANDMLAPLVSRIKIISGLDITENRIPQDGRVNLLIEEKEIDIRVSTFPTIHGENLVMRVLDRAVLNLDINKLGIPSDILLPFEKAIQSAYGIVLVVGPTGSGKTTTLYAALNKINSIHKNIVTIEDPIEYSLNLIRQTQVNLKTGMTFASGLRSVLRQDPDIILVGEVRDLETTQISIQAALTGHLVFSTVHTNDAPSTMARLMDIGAEPFLLVSSVNAVLAQRLVRRICPECKESYVPDRTLLDSLGMADSSPSFYRGKGCIHCRHSGYSGRIGIFEMMTLNNEIRELVIKKESSTRIKQAVIANGMTSMFDDGLKKSARRDNHY